MKITLHVKEDDLKHTVEDKTYLGCCIKLLQHVKLTYEPERIYCKEILEGLAALTEENEMSEFDFSSPESAFSLKFEE
jgi:hypothetical protein